MKASFYLYPIFLFAASCSFPTPSPVPIVSVDESFSSKSVSMGTTEVDDTGAIVLSEDTLSSVLRARNPSLAAARKLIDEARGQLESSGLRSNPTVEVEFETTANFREPFLTAGISRSFPRTQRLLLEKRVSAPLVEAARAEVANAERLLVGEALEKLVEIQFLSEKKILLEKQAENARELVSFISAAAERGEASLLEGPTAEIEASRLITESEQVQIQLDLARARLAPMVGLRDGSRLVVTGELRKPDLPPLQVNVPQKRPDLVAARLRARSAAENILLTQAQGVSDYDFGVFAGVGLEEDTPEDREVEGIVGVRFSMPLGTDPKTPGAMRSAQARRARLDLTTEALHKVIAAEIRASYGEMVQWHKLAGRIRQMLIPKAQENLGQVKTAYEKGQLPLQDVLRAREQELSLKLSELEAKKNFHQARARYLTATAI